MNVKCLGIHHNDSCLNEILWAYKTLENKEDGMIKMLNT